MDRRTVKHAARPPDPPHVTLTFRSLLDALVVVLALVSAAVCVAGALVYSLALGQRGAIRTAGPAAPRTTAR
jgi:hypothetical protein